MRSHARLRPILGALAAALFATSAARADAPQAVVAEIDALVQAEMTRVKIPGLSVAVSAENAVDWTKGYGEADVENRVPTTADTMFRLASISKTITAVAVMQLAEAGKLDLDAPVNVYCPAFGEKAWPVTTRQLLAHTGGVRHYKSDYETIVTRHYYSIVEALHIFKDDDLAFEPGSQFSYTTYGYNVLGCAIEGASGQTFLSYVNDKIFRPAGMDRIRDDNPLAIIPWRAAGYLPTHAGGLQNSDLVDVSYKIPGGGFIGRPTDLVRFAAALMRGELVRDETRDQMWTEQTTTEGDGTDYGLGWELKVNNGTAEVYHGGAQQGVTTVLYMLPEHGVAASIMVNRELTSLKPLVRKIANVLLRHVREGASLVDPARPVREIRLID